MSKKILMTLIVTAFIMLPASAFAAGAIINAGIANYPNIDAAITAAAVGDIVEIPGGSYAEDINVTVADQLTIRCSNADSTVTLTGSATAGNAVVTITGGALAANKALFTGITFTSNTSKSAATPVVKLNAVSGVKFFDCTFDPLTYSNEAILSIGLVGTTSVVGLTVEYCTFDLAAKALLTGIKFTTAAAVTNVNIIGNTFSGYASGSAGTIASGSAGSAAMLASDDLTEFSSLYFAGNSVSKCVTQVNYDQTALTATIKDIKIYANLFTNCNGFLMQSTDGSDDFVALANGDAPSPKIGLGGQIQIKGNHFGSATTEGDKRFAVMLYGFNALAFTEANIHIQYNNFQLPMTNGTDSNGWGGHVSAAGGTSSTNYLGSATKLDASYNWWGSTTGPMTAYEDGGLAVVNQTAYSYANYITTYDAPQVDVSTRGVEIFDYDEDGHVDRAVVWFDRTIDPASIASYNGWAMAGYQFNTTKFPRLSLDNDNNGTPDGDKCLTLFLTEGTAYDTGGPAGAGVMPEVTYTKSTSAKAAASTGVVAGITGNINARLGNVLSTDVVESDKANPVIETVTTGDANKNGKIDQITVVMSEIVTLTGGTNSDATDNSTSFTITGYAKFTPQTAAAPNGVLTNDTLVLKLTEGAVVDTDAKPQLDFLKTKTTLVTAANDYIDTKGNYLSTVSIPTTSTKLIDGAKPVALTASVEDRGNTLAGYGAVLPPDGYVDTYSLTFSEPIFIAAADTAAAQGGFSSAVDLNGNTITFPADTQFLIAGSSMSVEAKSDKVLFNTDQTPALTYTDGGGIKDAEGNTWVYTVDGAALGTSVFSVANVNDLAKPIMTRATGQVASKKIFVEFSEPVTGPAAAAIVVANFEYNNVYTTGINAGAISAVADGNATLDQNVELTTDENLLLFDIQQDSIRVAVGLAIVDMSASLNTMVQRYITIYDGVAPILLSYETADCDADGWIDHIKLTFDETLNDATLAGWQATDKLTTTAATWWGVEGYTVVGINPVSNPTEQTAATLDATTRAVAFSADGNNKVIIPNAGAGDTANDTILWLMVLEGSGADAVDGDTDAVPQVTMVGGTADGAKVGDYTPNYVVSADVKSVDNAGPAIMSASLLNANQLQAVLSETVADTIIVNATGTSTGPEIMGSEFTINFGSAWMSFTASEIKDIVQDPAGTLTMTWPTTNIPADNPGLIGFSSAGVVRDMKAGGGVVSTQLFTDTWNTGQIAIAAYTATGGSGTGAQVALLSPNGGELYSNGASVNILWTSASVTSVTIKSSTDGGDTWSDIAVVAAADGKYVWTAAAGNNMLIQVADQDGAASDMSDAVFNIEAVPVAVTIAAPTNLVVEDIVADNGNWFLASITTIPGEHLSLVKSYQFYRKMEVADLPGDSVWVYTAVVPAGYVDPTTNVFTCLVPTPINGECPWSVIASTGDIISDMATAKDSDVAVAMLVDAAAKPAVGILLSGMSEVAIGGAIDNIAPSAITTYAGADNAGANAGIKVTWVAPADHAIVGQYGNPGFFWMPIYGVNSYDVYRKASGQDTFTKVGSAGSLSTSFVDATAADGSTVYEYYVKATDGTFEVMTGSVWAMANRNANQSDFTSNGKVDFDDFLMFAAAYGKKSADAGWVSLFDLVPSNEVDFDDFLSFSADYGFGSEGAAKVAIERPMSDLSLSLTGEADEATSMYYVNVNLSDVDAINGFEFTMSYNDMALELAKESISGLVGLNISTDKDGILTVASMFNGEKFDGSVTIGFRSLSRERNISLEITNALVADNNFGVSTVADLSSATLKVLPAVYELSKNFPNPFNPTTTIEYSIPTAGNVELVIFNMTGQKVRTLVNQTKDAGFYKAVWDGKNEMGETAASGMYFYKLVSGNFNKIEKMTLIK